MLEVIQKIKYFIYCRKSTGRQEEKSPSIEAQFDELSAFAQKEGLEIVDVFKETHSAFENGRPKFQEMIDRIRNGEANGILTWEVSRLSRNLQDTATLDKLLHDKQLLKIQSPRQDYVDKDGEDFLLNMEFVISRQYSKEISRRVKRGLRYKLNQKREWPGWSPLGYVNINNETQSLSGQMTPHKRQVQKLLYTQWMKKDYKPRKIELDPIKSPLVKKSL